MEIYYQNSRNEKVYLDRYPYQMTAKTDLFDYEWESTGSNGKNIIGAYRKNSKKEINLIIKGTDGLECMENYKKLVDIIDIDTHNKNPGRLYVGNGYMNCWIMSSKYSDDYSGKKTMLYTLSVVPKEALWIYESVTSFSAAGNGLSDDISDNNGNAINYPYDYPVDYASGIERKNLINNAYSDTDFEITVYGSCQNPEINIGGHKYSVRCQLATGEYLKINSMTKKIYKVEIDGTNVNQFHLRDRDNYIFQKIRAGTNTVTWSGLFGFDITLLEKRSEPRWT